MLPTLHALLDATEAAVLESMEEKKDREKYMDAMYRPKLELAPGLAGAGYKPKPAGFDDDEVDASFDAFASAARAGR